MGKNEGINIGTQNNIQVWNRESNKNNIKDLGPFFYGIFCVYFVHNEKAYYINIVVIGSDDNRRKTKVQNRIVGNQWNHILLTTKKGVV
jgi:hypothetical protein